MKAIPWINNLFVVLIFLFTGLALWRMFVYPSSKKGKEEHDKYMRELGKKYHDNGN